VNTIIAVKKHKLLQLASINDDKILVNLLQETQVTQTTQQNLINIFKDFNSWKLTTWYHTYANEITQLIDWLKTPKQSEDEIRSYLLERRLSLLQSGISVDTPIIKLLNFAVMQCIPKMSMQPVVPNELIKIVKT
jgi:hypothetical protein